MRFLAVLWVGDEETTADLSALTAARALADRAGTTAQGLIAGPGARRAVALAQTVGLDEILLAEPVEGCDAPPEQQIAGLVAVAAEHATVAAGADSNVLLLVNADPLHESLAAQLAAQIGATPLGRVQEIVCEDGGALTATKASFGGRMRVTQRLARGPATASVRAGAIASTRTSGIGSPASFTPVQTAVRSVSVPRVDKPGFEVVACSEAERHAPLEGARIVLSGGRGVGDPEGFALLYDIALRIGAAVGASLPAVDAGLAPVARQVGQSGKYVRPDIYLAIGISGTPQHMAGIDPQTRVIAINNDPEAPIFCMASTGIVGDWKVILPALRDTLDT